MATVKVKWKKRVAFALVFAIIITAGLLFMSFSAMDILKIVPVLTAFVTGINIYLRVL